ncbi:ATP-binding cassette domain-containing protein [Microbacterium panaciterrae]|uniref:ABC transporter domain-containing protein n=1 Tax=Microbacterium panaciterrae TaxID=985759 RepID=A0ABP8PUE7_9MICO
MTALLEIEGLVKDFRVGPPLRKSTFHAVKGVSFRIEAGSSYGLVGESGSGKTTVARMVAQLNSPTTGAIRFDGQDVTRLNGRALRAYRRDVQMVFQDPYGALNPRMSVLELISEPWEIHGLHSRADRLRRAATLLDQVGLAPSALERKPIEFSGGQRQRIMIARALALEPRLIVADEPVSALDVSVQAQVLNLMKDLQDELGLTYLFISHDLSVVEFLCDRVGVMLRGDLVEEGDCDSIYRSPRTEYTKDLLRAIPPLPDVVQRDLEEDRA